MALYSKCWFRKSCLKRTRVFKKSKSWWPTQTNADCWQDKKSWACCLPFFATSNLTIQSLTCVLHLAAKQLKPWSSSRADIAAPEVLQVSWSQTMQTTKERTCLLTRWTDWTLQTSWLPTTTLSNSQTSSSRKTCLIADFSSTEWCATFPAVQTQQ